MEREVWLRMVSFVHRLAKPAPRRFTYSDELILLVELWAALWSRPVSWACRCENWPADLRPARLPTPSTMTRRRRRPAVAVLRSAVERRTHGPQKQTLLHMLDGKALPIAKHSRAGEAGFGRGVGGLAKGYKLHVMVGKNGHLAAWHVAALNQDEAKVAAAELLPHVRFTGYLLADKNYDRNALYAACRGRGIQLLAPRRYGPHRGLGNRPHDPARRYAVQQLEQSLTGFAPQLFRQRHGVERWLGSFTSSPYGLTHLPPWTRGLQCVRCWVADRLIVYHCARRAKKRVA
jgi:hypothetical protein